MRTARGDTLEVRIAAPPAEWDRLAAELFELGTLGIEERDGEGLIAWFRADWDRRAELHALEDAARGVRVAALRLRPDEDWARSWREGLGARQVAGLWIRPSWVRSSGLPELVIDPAQAFGSGEHASTRLALDLLIGALRSGDRLLDFGAGSGILALAALRLGAERAVGVEIDPVACRNAAENAELNDLCPDWLCGSLDAVAASARFDGAVANLLWSRLEPCLARVAAHATRFVVLSGFLASERASVIEAVHACNLEIALERSEPQSGDHWHALLVEHR
jgi:ribosomal protein L11 methyltransferase